MNLGGVKQHDIYAFGEAYENLMTMYASNAGNLDRIVDTFAEHREDEHFSHLANYDEIAANDYNLSVSTYVEAEDTREKVDIVKLNAEIAEIVAREDALRAEIDAIIEEIEG